MGSLLSIALESEQRKLANKQLMEEQSRFRNLVSNIPSAIVILVGKSIRFANEAAAQLALLDSPAEVLGSDASSYFDGREVRRLRQIYSDLLSGRSALYTSEHVFRRSDGTTRVVEMIASRVTWNGEPAIQAMLQDVTDRVEAERQAAEAGEQFRKLADSFPGGFTYIDASERYTFVNRTYADWLGMIPQDFIVRTVGDVAGADAYAVVKHHIRTVLTGRSVVFERQSNYPSAGELDVQVSYIPDFDEHGTPQGFFALVTDVTEQKVAEVALKQAQRIESLGLLTGGISHDFNNLLAIIIGNVELAQLGSPGSKTTLEERLNTILRAAERGAELTHGLLAFSRQQALEPRVVDVRDTIPDLVTILRRTLGADIEITTTFADDLWLCAIDPGQLDSALLNLAINARDAMPGGGTLTLSASNVRIARAC